MSASRLGTGLRWLLVASLALNAALLAGIAWEHFDRDGPRRGRFAHHASGTMMPNPMMLRGALPEERRAVVDEVLERHRGRIRETVRDVFDARADAHALMIAETVDPQALDRAFANLRERDAEAAQAVQAMLADLVSRLTPEERRALGDAMHRSHRGGPRHRDAPPAPDAPGPRGDE